MLSDTILNINGRGEKFSSKNDDKTRFTYSFKIFR
jgi:hypothetical protein